MYGPLGLAAIGVAVLVLMFPGKGVDRRSHYRNVVLFLAAFVLFVAIDLVTGRGITGNPALPPFAIALTIAAFVIIVIRARR